MKDEEKAEEYVKVRICKALCPLHSCEKKCSLSVKECHHTKQTYKTYFDGLTEDRKGKNYFNKFVHKCKEIEELKEKLKGFESGEVAWQGDMDATIKQNLELKSELSEIKTAIRNYSKAETYQQQEIAWNSLLEFIN